MRGGEMEVRGAGQRWPHASNTATLHLGRGGAYILGLAEKAVGLLGLSGGGAL
jgi:hypothetical protein